MEILCDFIEKHQFYIKVYFLPATLFLWLASVVWKVENTRLLLVLCVECNDGVSFAVLWQKCLTGVVDIRWLKHEVFWDKSVVCCVFVFSPNCSIAVWRHVGITLPIGWLMPIILCTVVVERRQHCGCCVKKWNGEEVFFSTLFEIFSWTCYSGIIVLWYCDIITSPVSNSYDWDTWKIQLLPSQSTHLNHVLLTNKCGK